MAEKKLRPGGLIEFYNEFKENHAYYVDKSYYSGEGGAKNRSDDDKKTVLFSLNRANTDCYTL